MNKSLLAVTAAFAAGIILTLGVDTVTDASEPTPEAPLFEFEQRLWTRHDLSPAIAEAFYQLEKDLYDRKTELLRKEVVGLYLEKVMAEKGQSRKEVMAKLLQSEAITEEQITSFYESNRHRINAAYEAVKPQIEEYLSYQQVVAAEERLLEKLRSEGKYTLNLAPPVIPVNVINHEGFPARGSDDPVVTLVKFADYQCAHCKRAAQTLDALMEEHGDKIRLIYMDFPINRSGISRKLAEAAVCADEQDKFWGYNQLVFDKQETLSAESPRRLAEDTGLDMAAFDQCMATQRPDDKVKQSETEAERLGLTGTPALFANGKRLTPADLEKGLKESVESLLD